MKNFLRSYTTGLRGKLLLLAFLPLLALSGTTLISFQGFSTIGGMLNESYEVYVPNIRLLGQINLNRANIGYFSFAALANKEDAKNREIFIGLLTTSVEAYKEAVGEYLKQTHIQGEKEIFSQVQQNFPKYIEYTEQVISALKRGQPQDYEFIVNLIDKGGPWQVLQIQIDLTVTKIAGLYTDLSKSK